MAASKSLTSESMSDGIRELKIRETNKHEVWNLEEETQDLGDGQGLASYGLQSAIESMTKRIPGNYGKTEEEDAIDKQHLSNVESNSSSVTEDASSTRDKLDCIENLLAPKNKEKKNSHDKHDCTTNFLVPE